MLSISELRATLVRIAEPGRAIRAARRTDRIFASLPASIRKDVGWPDLWEEPHGRGR